MTDYLVTPPFLYFTPTLHRLQPAVTAALRSVRGPTAQALWEIVSRLYKGSPAWVQK